MVTGWFPRLRSFPELSSMPLASNFRILRPEKLIKALLQGFQSQFSRSLQVRPPFQIVEENGMTASLLVVQAGEALPLHEGTG